MWTFHNDEFLCCKRYIDANIQCKPHTKQKLLRIESFNLFHLKSFIFLSPMLTFPSKIPQNSTQSNIFTMKMKANCKVTSLKIRAFYIVDFLQCEHLVATPSSTLWTLKFCCMNFVLRGHFVFCKII